MSSGKPRLYKLVRILNIQANGTTLRVQQAQL